MVMKYKKVGLNICAVKAKPVNMNCLWAEYVLSVVVFELNFLLKCKCFRWLLCLNYFFSYILNLDM